MSKDQQMIAEMFFATTMMASGCLEVTAGHRLIGLLCWACSAAGWLRLYVRAR